MFWRFWGASSISRLGDGVTAVALPLVAVATLDATSFQVGLVTAGDLCGMALPRPAGRRPGGPTAPSRHQVAMDLVRAAALLSIPVAGWLDALSLISVVLVALVVSAATVIFDVGNSTFIVSVVSKDELTSRNSLMSATNSTTQLVGPSLGGVLVQLLGAVTALLADVVSFLLSAVLLMRLPRPDPRRTEGEHGHRGADPRRLELRRSAPGDPTVCRRRRRRQLRRRGCHGSDPGLPRPDAQPPRGATSASSLPPRDSAASSVGR